MRKAIILLSIFLLFCLHIDADGNANDQNDLRYEIVKKEFHTDKYITDKYITVTARAVIQGNNLTKDSIQKALNLIITEIRKQDNPDTIRVYAYKEKEDAERAAYDFSGFISLAHAIWLPQGQGKRLHPKNEKNIQNKESYETRFNIPEQEEIPEETIVSMFDKKTRKKIFYEFDEADYWASVEANKYYPIDHGWSDVADPVYRKNFLKARQTQEQILVKFRKQIMSKYKLTGKEVEKIEREAILDRWPNTNHYYLYAHTWKEDYGNMVGDGSFSPDGGER